MKCIWNSLGGKVEIMAFVKFFERLKIIIEFFL